MKPFTSQKTPIGTGQLVNGFCNLDDLAKQIFHNSFMTYFFYLGPKSVGIGTTTKLVATVLVKKFRCILIQKCQKVYFFSSAKSYYKFYAGLVNFICDLIKNFSLGQEKYFFNFFLVKFSNSILVKIILFLYQIGIYDCTEHIFFIFKKILKIMFLQIFISKPDFTEKN